MPLTLDEATRAGALAAAIVAADEAIAGLDARIGESAQIVGMVAQLATGTSVRAGIPMTAAESAAVFNAVKTIVQSKRAALVSALEAIN